MIANNTFVPLALLQLHIWHRHMCGYRESKRSPKFFTGTASYASCSLYILLQKYFLLLKINSNENSLFCCGCCKFKRMKYVLNSSFSVAMAGIWSYINHISTSCHSQPATSRAGDSETRWLLQSMWDYGIQGHSWLSSSMWSKDVKNKSLLS